MISKVTGWSGNAAVACGMETSKLLPWVWLEAQYNYKVLLSLEDINRTFMTRHRRKLLCVRSKSCVSDEVWPHMEFDSRFRKCIMFTARCCGCLEQIFKFFNALMLIIAYCLLAIVTWARASIHVVIHEYIHTYMVVVTVQDMFVCITKQNRLKISIFS